MCVCVCVRECACLLSCILTHACCTSDAADSVDLDWFPEVAGDSLLRIHGAVRAPALGDRLDHHRTRILRHTDKYAAFICPVRRVLKEKYTQFYLTVKMND